MTEPRTRVLIADDDRVVRDALADLISGQPDLELVGVAVDHPDVIRLAIQDRPRVVVLDVRMPGGTASSTVRAILDRTPTTAVLVLSAYADPAVAVEVLSAGASGYLVKGVADEEILEGITRSSRGQVSISARLARECVRALRRQLEHERRAEAATSHNANVLRQLVDRMPYAAVLLGANARIELVNARVQQLFGYRRTELLGKEITKLIPASARGEPSDELIGRLLGQEPLGEYPPEASFPAGGRRQDGTEFAVEVVASRMSAGQRGVAVFFRDISELRQAESEYRQLFECSPDAIVIIDGTGTVQLLNAATERLFGYSRDDLIGHTVDVLLPNHPITVYHKEGEGPTDSQTALTPFGLELIGRRRDGTDFPIDVSVSRIPTEEGVRVMLAIRDMTEIAGSRAVLEHSLEVLRTVGEGHRNLLVDLVRAQERERMRIAAGIHDDSLQVITATALRLQQLRRRLRDPDDLRVLSKLEETVKLAADRLRLMIFDFRAPVLEQEGLVAALNAYLEQLQSDAGVSYELDSELEAEPPPETRVVIYRIAQEALMNVRIHAQATRVRVRLSNVDDGCLVEIVDNGVGYNPLEAEAKTHHLGLSLMRSRAEIAGGWARVESEPGAGTAVEFWVPFEAGLGGGDS